MKHAGKLIIAMILLMLFFVYMGWTYAGLALCVFVVLLPAKYDPAIQYKLNREKNK